jgi:hypothetical protein
MRNLRFNLGRALAYPFPTVLQTFGPKLLIQSTHTTRLDDNFASKQRAPA